MSSVCNLCGHEGLDYSESFLGADGVDIKVAVCGHCHSFIPEYVIDSSSEADALSQQVKFHEEWWDESSEEELRSVLLNIKSLVSGLSKFLGPGAPEKLVLELGSGRGSLLRALLDGGYGAYGCEPAPKLVALARKYYDLDEEKLFEVSGDYFLDTVVPTLPGDVQIFILWHVLEHVKSPMCLLRKLYGMLNDGGGVILQLPMFCKQYTYPEHYFFPSHATFDFMAKNVGFQVEDVDYDLNNFFVTICFRRSSVSVSRKVNELTEKISNLSPLSEAIFLRDEVLHQREMAVAAQTKIINEKIQGMSLMDTFIKERDKTIIAQAALIDEKVYAMDTMSLMIEERDKALVVQAAIIDDHVAEVGKLTSIIDDRDEALVAARKIIDQHLADISRITSLADEQEKVISIQLETIDVKKSMLEASEAVLKNVKDDFDQCKRSPVFKLAKLIRLIK